MHLVRHGEVDNPAGLLYGRLPDYHLSDLGREMAGRVAEDLRDRDIVHLRCSPLERAQETMAPLAEALGLPVIIDGRVIEAANYLEGLQVSFRRRCCGKPQELVATSATFKPSWGEAYTEIVARMRLAMKDAAEARAGHEAVIVSHQLPIWMARATPRAAGWSTIRASGSARWPASPRSATSTPGSPRSATRAGRRPAPSAPDQEVRRGGLSARELAPSIAGGLASCDPAAARRLLADRRR